MSENKQEEEIVITESEEKKNLPPNDKKECKDLPKEAIREDSKETEEKESDFFSFHSFDGRMRKMEKMMEKLSRGMFGFGLDENEESLEDETKPSEQEENKSRTFKKWSSSVNVNGFQERKTKVFDSEEGEREEVFRQIGDRSVHKIVTKKSGEDEKVEEKLKNIKEEELDKFQSDWEKRMTDESLPCLEGSEDHEVPALEEEKDDVPKKGLKDKQPKTKKKRTIDVNEVVFPSFHRRPFFNYIDDDFDSEPLSFAGFFPIRRRRVRRRRAPMFHPMSMFYF